MMNYQENKNLIRENVVPLLTGKLFISNNVICLCNYDTIKLLYTLKNELPISEEIVYQEMRSEYLKQAKENITNGNYCFDFNLTPYAKKHGLVKELKKQISC